MKEIKPTCQTGNRDIIHGQILILGTSLEKEDFALLTKEQTEIIKAEIRLVRRK
jgi:hypothetical protein